MARMASILLPSGDADIKLASLGTSTSSTEQKIGANRIFVINADQDITIRFGATGMGAADATYYRIPANQQTTFDMGPAFSYIRAFNLSASTAANVYIKILSLA